MYQESPKLELRQQITDTFLKTVSAFANQGGGEIIFGITDDGEVLGMPSPEDAMLTIENKINSTINPRPDYSIEKQEDNTIKLSVNSGPFKPYTYKNKAYQRFGTSTVEVDRYSLNRPILDGNNQSYDNLPAPKSNYTFETLEIEFKRVFNFDSLAKQTLITLGLMTINGEITIAGALFADTNNFPGIEAVVFGNSINEIRSRRNLAGSSILTQLQDVYELFTEIYAYEKIEGKARKATSHIPKHAFREAIANAVAHRNWSIPASIKVSMFPQEVVIASPGPLPAGVSEEDFMRGNLSILRNPAVGDVLNKLKLIEKFGTRIPRIQQAYQGALVGPEFVLTPGSISVTLPVFTMEQEAKNEESLILTALSQSLSRSAIAKETGLHPQKALRVINGMLDKRMIRRSGTGRATRYHRI